MSELTQLKMVRKAEKISQESIAEVLGIDRKTYSRYEKGLSPIPSDILIALSKELRVSTDFILGLDTHLNKGTEEFMEYTGLSEQSIETLRQLHIEDIELCKFQLIGLSMGAPVLTALQNRNIKVLDTFLANADRFGSFATAFIHFANNDFTYPVHREMQPDGCDKWVPIKEHQLGLCTDLSKPEDSVAIKLNEYNTRALHKNTLDFLINDFADKYHKDTHKKIPALEKSDTTK